MKETIIVDLDEEIEETPEPEYDSRDIFPEGNYKVIIEKIETKMSDRGHGDQLIYHFGNEVFSIKLYAWYTGKYATSNGGKIGHAIIKRIAWACDAKGKASVSLIQKLCQGKEIAIGVRNKGAVKTKKNGDPYYETEVKFFARKEDELPSIDDDFPVMGGVGV